MLNIIKDSFRLTNKYIILATPLILFSLISSLYLIFSINGREIGILFSMVLFFLMLCAFVSGWLFMVKQCVAESDYDVNSLIAEFPAGVGEYFLSTSGMILIAGTVSFIIMLIFFAAGLHFIGDTATIKTVISASGSTENLKTVLSSMSQSDLIKLNQWNLVMFLCVIISHFLMMFYAPALMYKTKNPFIAFFVSIKDLLSRKFFKNFALFFIIVFLYITISLLTTITGNNIIMRFVFTLINFYYMVFAIVYLFNYYYKTFVQIGSNIDTRV